MAGDGLRGIRTGTPVPSTTRESSSARNAVHTENWGPDGVAKYIEQRFGEKIKHSGSRPLNLNLKREGEGEMALFTLTREEYLDERRTGKTRQEIAKEHGINVPGLKYHLRKWDLLDPAIEDAEMDKSSESTVALAAEANNAYEVPREALVGTEAVEVMEPTPEPIDLQIHYEKTSEPAQSVEPDEQHGHFVTVRIPVEFNGWSDALKTDVRAARINRNETIMNGAQMLQNAIAWVWVELSDILGPGDYTAQVEQYIERKLVALGE